LSEQSDKRDAQHLARINAELKESLKNCRAILRDCQERLAANANDADSAADQHDSKGRNETR
jgi:hypothetical protein